MTDRIQKVLNKLSEKERQQLTAILELVVSGKLSSLDLKKLKGHQHAYRVRKGDFRIIFTMTTENVIHLIAIERRTSRTYAEF